MSPTSTDGKQELPLVCKPGECHGPNFHAEIAHLLAEVERLRSEMGYHEAKDVIEQLTLQRDTVLKKLAKVEVIVRTAVNEAQDILIQKGSYDTSVDPRVLEEYERAYSFIQKVAAYRERT